MQGVIGCAIYQNQEITSMIILENLAPHKVLLQIRESFSSSEENLFDTSKSCVCQTILHSVLL